MNEKTEISSYGQTFIYIVTFIFQMQYALETVEPKADSNKELLTLTINRIYFWLYRFFCLVSYANIKDSNTKALLSIFLKVNVKKRIFPRRLR